MCGHTQQVASRRKRLGRGVARTARDANAQRARRNPIWAISVPLLLRFRQHVHTRYLSTLSASTPTFVRRSQRIARPSPKQFHYCTQGAALHLLVRPSFHVFHFHFFSCDSPILRFCPSGDASYGERPISSRRFAQPS